MNKVPGCTVAVIVVAWLLAFLFALSTMVALVYAIVHWLMTH